MLVKSADVCARNLSCPDAHSLFITPTRSLPRTRDTGSNGVSDSTSCQLFSVIFTCAPLTPPLPRVESSPTQVPPTYTSAHMWKPSFGPSRCTYNSPMAVREPTPADLHM